MKFIIVGDIHCDFVGPKTRTENFYSCFLDKMQQITKIAKENNIKHIICLGDFFENYVVDYFEKIIYDLAPIMSQVNWYSLIGNHDSKRIDQEVYGTSFGALVASGLIKDKNELKKLIEKEMNCDFYDYWNKDEFSNKIKHNNNKLSIAFIHDFIMPNNTKENFEFKKCEETNYDYVFLGHYHYDFDEIVGKTRYINPGSLMRLTISERDKNKQPKVIIFDTKGNGLVEYKFLETKKDVFDLENKQNTLSKDFDSKFAKMLVDKNLADGNSSDIIDFLKKNKIDEKIVQYVTLKLEDIKND
ncbi:MAG: metallophosphoesterase family protein [Staphylococcus sp.]|nr:metallophosphoesterase family protein [Staphylococcus sp.]